MLQELNTLTNPDLGHKIQAPYIYNAISTLGGKDKASLIIKISLDAQDTWANSIFYNSRYAMFHIGYDGKMELFNKQYTMPKFRCCTVNSIDNVINKINIYIANAKN